MDLIILVLALALIGFIVYWVTTHVPMGPHWATFIRVVTAVIVVIWLLRQFGGIIPNVM